MLCIPYYRQENIFHLLPDSWTWSSCFRRSFATLSLTEFFLTLTNLSDMKIHLFKNELQSGNNSCWVGYKILKSSETYKCWKYK